MRATLLPCLLVAACASAPPAIPAPSPEGPLDRAPSEGERAMLARQKLRTEALRGHAFTRDFDVRVVNANGMRARFLAAMQTSSDEDDTREERLLETIALLPDGYDLETGYLRHVESDVVGAYMLETDTLLLLEGAFGAADVRTNDSMIAQLTVVHELVHALQDDPSFPAEEAADRELTWDEMLVRQSIVEGDATFAMLVAYARATGVDVVRLASNPRGLALLAQYALEAAPSVEGQPALLTTVTAATYAYGSAFVAGRFVEGGWDAVDEAHVTPPASMEQIVHPARTGDTGQYDVFYTEDLEGFDAVIEDLGYAIAKCDRFGELGLRALFEGVGGAVTSEIAADGWNGDEACLYERPGERDVAMLITTWDSIRDAVEAVEAFRQVSLRLAPLGRSVRVERVQRAVLVTYDVDEDAREDLHDELYRFAHYTLSGTAAPMPRRR